MVKTQYIVFSINQQPFGIEIFKVKEVLSYRKITPLPQMEGFIKGIINLRGAIIPVFDLREKFNLPIEEYTQFHVIIVVEISGRIMGIIVDDISDVLEILPEEFQTTGNLPPNIRREYLKGVGKKGDEMIILLDMNHLLSPQELELADAT
ncbi:MAG: chemotaxis protein CheW [Proteobacteria bacterium]|nr:purine-binding chemotaxis protein CheW [Desulfobacteraceae bacterium]MBU4209471.1 chemotaxis protein CheW [Pseudomonadota bacterium]MBU4419502.1 chemotaxis protein CheW [Pseudomonadota bacterium]MCG2830512.1 chemotaxis protein CheW [Desulfobacteraceae bacterium]